MNTFTQSDDELLEALGVEANPLSVLVHVKPKAPRKPTIEVAAQTPCKDFDRYVGLFNTISSGLKTKSFISCPFKGGCTDILKGNVFILNGLLAFVASTGKRLRVIYSNGTESNLLSESLVRALYKDTASRRVFQG